MTTQPGQLFGNYCVVRLIGEGGFGEVYLVENSLIQRRAAVKVLHPALAQDEELVRRFLNEARAASAICHPNIVEVLDAGWTSNGVPYILMEFLEGVSLQKRLADRGRHALPVVLDIANQTGSALVAAHAAGIVHRDLKPENLFLVPDPHTANGERVKVLDFGIAKIRLSGGSGGTVRTRTGMIVGSPAYMSPEQCKDSADVDVRSDVYSFATIVYEMLAGRTPHVAETGTELLFMHLTKAPTPLRELAPQVPLNVEAAIMRGLAREREDRFDSMIAFVDALHEELASRTPKRIISKEIISETRLGVATGTNRPVMMASSTTLSKATGEMGLAAEQSTEIDEEFLSATRQRRWPVLAVGSTVLLGCVLLLLLRPKQDVGLPPMHNGTSVAAKSLPAPPSSVPNSEEPLRNAEPKRDDAIPGNALTKPQPALLAGGNTPPAAPKNGAASSKGPPSKLAHQAASQTTSHPFVRKRNPDEQWLAH